jgi:predicted GTPase
VPADAVVDATPVNLARLLKLNTPIVDVRYEFHERGNELPALLERFERRYLTREPLAAARP